EAGTARYYCKVHPTQMHGVVAVPVKLAVKPGPMKNGHPTRIVAMRWASAAPVKGEAFDVQVKRGSGRWIPFRSVTRDASGKLSIFNDEHDQLRESIRAFAQKELAPHAEEWEETTFPDWVFRRMGELGYLGLSYPEEYGGQGGDYYSNIVLAEEIGHSNSGGLAMGVAVHTDMATPPVFMFGTEEQKQRYLVPSIKGEKISCLGITEPDAGSDVAGIRTRAVREDGEWVINGSKTYITNGHRAD